MTGLVPSGRAGVVERTLHQVAAWDTPGAAPIDPVPDDTASELVAAAIATRISGPLLAAIDAGEVTLPDAAVDELAHEHHRALLWCVHIEARLLEIRDWFAAAGGVEHRVIKGPAVAHLDEPDPALRTFADLDLLVAARDLDRAVRALGEHGVDRGWAERRPGFDRRFAKSVTTRCDDGVEVDLHRTIVDGVYGVRIPTPELFTAPESFDLGGEAVPALSAVHRLVHCAYHAVLGSPTPALMSLRDLAGYLTRDDLGPDAVLPVLGRWRGEAVMAVALDLVIATLSFDPGEWARWRTRHRIEPAEAARIERHRAEGSSFGRAKLDALREMAWRDRAAYALALAVPSGAHLRSRGLRRRDLLR